MTDSKQFAIPAVPDNQLPEHLHQPSGEQVDRLRIAVCRGRPVKQDIQFRTEPVFRLPVIDQKRHSRERIDDQRLIGERFTRQRLCPEQVQDFKNKFLMDIGKLTQGLLASMGEKPTPIR